MRETSAFLSLVAGATGEIAAVSTHVCSGRGGQGVVRRPGKFVVGSPKLVEFQSEFRAVTGVVARRRGLLQLVRGGGCGRWNAVLGRGVYRHFSVSEFTVVAWGREKNFLSLVNSRTMQVTENSCRKGHFTLRM